MDWKNASLCAVPIEGLMDLEAVIGEVVERGIISGDESNECRVVDAEGKMLAPFP
jgi:hypothetical protein